MKQVPKTPRVALVYDWVNTRYGGAEQVLLQLHLLYPTAPLFTSVYLPEEAAWAKDFVVKSSLLQRLPFLRRHHRLIAGLMPIAFETLNLQNFDLIISITSAEAKGVLTSPDQLHLCYLLTPTRYLWSHTQAYQQAFWIDWLRKIVFGYLMWWDRTAANRPDQIIPISRVVAARAKQFYHRQTLPVIYPPVSFEQGKIMQTEKNRNEGDLSAPLPLDFHDYYLVVGRLVSYKKIELAIQACLKLGRKLLIIGDGPERSRLTKIAGKSKLIYFLRQVPSADLPHFYEQCLAFLAPGEEDFGISPLQALLVGKPAIIYQRSGAAELIQNHRSGIYLPEQSLVELVRAMQQVESQAWDSSQIKQSISAYDAVQFRSQFRQAVDSAWQLFEKGNYE